MTSRLRVFISSPGDVRRARLVAAQTVEKIAPDYLRAFQIEPYLWETEALVASGHFQDAIEPPSQFDIVVLIVWSRLGTELPERTSVRAYAGIDGRTPVTGTEWEFEDALREARKGGAPDLLVYRSLDEAKIDAWDPDKRDVQLKQLRALDAFWARHFADRGAFIGAYHQFDTLEHLASHLEAHLRQLIERRMATLATGDAAARLWARPPFMGLSGYGFDEAPVFFGRSEAIAAAIAQLTANAEAHRAFLLVLGASGSGKSSLARAGIAPRLSIPRLVTELAFLRRASFRPGDRAEGEDIFAAFARHLVAGDDGEGVPEFGPPERLAQVMRAAPATLSLFLDDKLDALTAAAHASGKALLHQQAAVILILDQLEELFTDRKTSPADRAGFITAIDALARRGRVWIVATMRADLWGLAAETPALVDLAAGTGRLDLLAPRGAEVRQMARLPAETAGIAFEAHPVTGVPLCDRIVDDAVGAPGALPLLSYVLDQLYETDVVGSHGHTLTYATYEALGGLEGAIAARAEAIFQTLPPQTQAQLPSLVFALAQVVRGESGGVTARRAPLAAFTSGSDARALVDALLDPSARLLTAEQAPDGAASVRVAHEALLSAWPRARRCIEDNALLLSIRQSAEARLLRWRGGGAGLLEGLDLDEAERLARDRGGDLETDLRDYIAASARQARRRRSRTIAIMAAVAAVMTLLALASGVAAFAAYQNAQRAETQLQDRVLLENEHDGVEDLKLGDAAGAVAKFQANVAIAASLTAREPGDPHWRFNLANAHAHLGQAWDAAKRPVQARAEYQAAMTAAAQIAKLDAGDHNLQAKVAALQTWLARRLG